MKLKSLLFLSAIYIFSSFIAPQGYKPGDVAMDFKLKNVDSKFVSLADFKNVKGYVVIFTCNECPVAKAYEDRIIKLHDKYASKGFQVIAINPNDPSASSDDSYELMQKRAVERAFKFPYLFDEGQKVYPVFGATRTPHAYLLDKDRVVKYIGAIDDNTNDEDAVQTRYLEKAIEEVSAGKAVTTPYTKAVGCGIKAKKA
jgi:peroxiredoxin